MIRPVDAVQYRKILEGEKASYLNRSQDFISGIETAIADPCDMSTLDTIPVRCKNCRFSFKLKDSAIFKESSYKYFIPDSTMCGCEDLIGDYPIVVKSNGFCYLGLPKETDLKQIDENTVLTVEEMMKLNGDPVYIDIGPGVYGLCFGSQDIVVLGDNQSISIETASTCNPRLVSDRETL